MNDSNFQKMWKKVPEVTRYFWLIKVFREVRAVHPNAQTAVPVLQSLLTILKNP